MQFRVIANQAAGNSERIEEAANRLPNAEVVWTETPEDLDHALHDLDDATPVVAGGDGTIHLIANRLVALGMNDRPLGILPMGTGNDLARGLGLPFEPEAAAQRIVSGNPVRLPLMNAPDDEFGVNNAHVGVGVAAARRGSEWKDRLGAFAYSAGSVTEGLTFEGLEVEVAVDDTGLFSGRALAVMVLVGPSAGGGFEPLADVAVAEPILDVVVVDAGDSVADRLGLAISALRGNLEGDDDVARGRGRLIEVEIKEAAAEWELDGEFRDWSSPVRLELSDQAWWVIS